MKTFSIISPARSRAVAGALTVVAALSLAACGDSQAVDHTITAAVVDGGPGFDPATITVSKTDHVKLTVGNSTDKTHGFTIVGYDIEREVEAGKPVDIEFTASRAGVYEIVCQLHDAHKHATLVVE